MQERIELEREIREKTYYVLLVNAAKYRHEADGIIEESHRVINEAVNSKLN
jgi:hypothetical protein